MVCRFREILCFGRVPHDIEQCRGTKIVTPGPGLIGLGVGYDQLQPALSDPAIGDIWPAILVAQLAIVGIVLSCISGFRADTVSDVRTS